MGSAALNGLKTDADPYCRGQSDSSCHSVTYGVACGRVCNGDCANQRQTTAPGEALLLDDTSPEEDHMEIARSVRLHERANGKFTVVVDPSTSVDRRCLEIQQISDFCTRFVGLARVVRVIRAEADRRTVASETPEVGVPEPFDAFYKREKQGILAVALSVSRRSFGAEDVVQEAFLRAFREWDQIGRYDSPEAWVRRVALNLATSRFRKFRSELKALTRLTGSLHSDEFSPRDEQLWREVRRLPKRQAQVIALTYVDDMTSSQVADVLGISPSTVRKHLTRARRQLEKRVTHEP